MNIQQFAKTLGERENQSPLLAALRNLCTTSMEQFKSAEVHSWGDWPPLTEATDLHTKA